MLLALIQFYFQSSTYLLFLTMSPPEPPKEGSLPRNLSPKGTVVEPAPSHDGPPCSTAYSVAAENTAAPQFILCIYDTTAAGASPEGTCDLAFKLHRVTEVERCEHAPASRP